MTALSIIAGLALLVLGGETLVRGAVGSIERLGVSPALVGLVVYVGTSLPELVTSVEAAAIGSPGIAIGNVVGSNIANLLLILGCAAVVAPIPVSKAALRTDAAFVLGSATLFSAIAWFATLDRLVGALLIAAMAAYVALSWRQEQAGAAAAGPAPPSPARRSGWGGALPLALLLLGLGLAVLGGSLLVNGAVALSRNLGVSEAVIGLTVVAIGTSLPELVTSVMAALRGQPKLALGNVLGSCVFNILGIAGVTALIMPTAAPPQIRQFDNPVMVAASAVGLAFAWTGWRIGRREGAALLALYAAYLVSTAIG